MQRFFWFLLLATVLWGAAMQVELTGYVPQPSRYGEPATECPPGKAPVLAQLELSKSAACFASLIAPLDDNTQNAKDDRETNVKVARINTCADFLFILLYWSTFLVFAKLLSTTAGRARWLWIGVALLTTAAAILDVGENWLMLHGFSAVLKNSLDFVAPGRVSTAKWCVFGVATTLLGFLCWAAESLWLRRVIAVLLMAGGVMTFFGTFRGNPSLIGLTIAMPLALFSYFPWRLPKGSVPRFVIYAYLLRFPILNALLLAVVLPAGYGYAPSIFYGLFDAMAPLSFFLICFASLLLALIIMITARIILAYAPDRFADLAGAPPWLKSSWWTTIWFSLLAAPMIVMTWIGSQSDGFSVWWKVGGLIGAVLAALLFLYATAELHAWIEDTDGPTVCFVYPPFPGISSHGEPSELATKTAQVVKAIVPDGLDAGYLRRQPVNGVMEPVLKSGHKVSTIAFFVTLMIYAAFGYWTAPNKTTDSPAAMFYVLLLLCLLTWFFGGVSFFLDKLRVPVLTAVLAGSMVLGVAGGTDHVYRLHDLPSEVPLLSPAQVIERWGTVRHRESRPIVVVATAGGGIRASAWTARVLTGLTKECGSAEPANNEFTSSVVLISSVSGGSEGAMYFAGWYGEDGKIAPGKEDEIFNESAETDLGAVGWGLVYPDLLRTVPGLNLLPLFNTSSERIDRGLALEREWVRHWTTSYEKRPRLSQWNKDVAAGSRPAVIFNGTVSETGDRFIAATTDLFAKPEDSQAGTLQFFRTYGKEDIDVSTAARLSATFPFVSPMSRADTDLQHAQLHIGDGGYYDNSGLLSATQWLMDAGEQLQGHAVYLVVIDSRSKEKQRGGVWSWQRQMVAPIGTLLSVRTNSQQARGQIELDAVEALEKSLGVSVTAVHFNYRADESAPLSWHLLKSQTKGIVDQWNDREKGSSDDHAEEVKMLQTLGCSVTPEGGNR